MSAPGGRAHLADILEWQLATQLRRRAPGAFRALKFATL